MKIHICFGSLLKTWFPIEEKIHQSSLPSNILPFSPKPSRAVNIILLGGPNIHSKSEKLCRLLFSHKKMKIICGVQTPGSLAFRMFGSKSPYSKHASGIKIFCLIASWNWDSQWRETSTRVLCLPK